MRAVRAESEGMSGIHAPQELLGSLRGMDEAALAGWAAANRERLTLAFLGWLAAEEAAASSTGAREELWELGSKLMALREGLAPVSMERLQSELRGAALAAAAGSSAEGEEGGGTGGSGPGGGGALATARPAGLGAVARRTAALGLSPEGLALLQQQAAALEAVVGSRRAVALTEVIGRKTVAPGEGLEAATQADEATRILEVLLSIPDREQRAALLPDAFTPPAAADGAAAAAAEGEDGGEEQLCTTPLRLLHALDLAAARLERGGGGGGGGALLAGGGLGLDAAELRAALRELREDVLAHWEATAADAF
eukprot:scaffold20.g7854.t1